MQHIQHIQNFTINQRGETVLSVVKGTEFLQALARGDEVLLFSIGPLYGDYEQREIHAFFSGYSLPIEEAGESYRYLGTAMLHGEAPIHVFERVKTIAAEQVGGKTGEPQQ